MRTSVSRRYSTRQWKTTAVLIAAGGVLGLHRFYIGRVFSGFFRLSLPLFAAILAGQNRAAATYPIWTHPVTAFLSFLGVGALIEAVFVIFRPEYRFRWFKPGINNLTSMKKLFDQFDVIASFFVFAFIFIRNIPPVFAKENFWHPAAFAACGALSGILWFKDLARVLYWNDLTDGKGRVLG